MSSKLKAIGAYMVRQPTINPTIPAELRPPMDGIEAEMARMIPRRSAATQMLEDYAPMTGQQPGQPMPPPQELLRQRQPQTQPTDVVRVGRLTAEALATEYESAAKAIEAMGAHLLDLQKRMDTEAKHIMTAIDEINAVAAHYREDGKRMFATIEECAQLTQRVRDICADLWPRPTKK